MASPVADAYSAPSGAAVYAGRYPGSSALSGGSTLGDVSAAGGAVGYSEPAWLAAHPAINEWFAISGTSGAGGAAVNAYSGFAFKESTSEIILSLCGGHLDSSDNRVVSLALNVDSPGAWTTRNTGSSSVTADASYNPDGLPASRHVYQHAHYIASLDKVFHIGMRFGYGGGTPTTTKVDGFSLATNTWDAAGTWPDVPVLGHYGVVQVKATGDIYTQTLRKRVPAGTWTDPITTRTSASIRFPVAHDSLRNQLFTLQMDDGEGFTTSPRVNASRIPLSGTTQYAVTFNASSAYTQWQADGPTDAAMDYDAYNDRFLFYNGQSGQEGRIYVINIPATITDPWDMSILTLGGGSSTPTVVPAAGVHNRFRYVPAYRGFVLLPQASSNLYFIRTG